MSKSKTQTKDPEIIMEYDFNDAEEEKKEDVVIPKVVIEEKKEEKVGNTPVKKSKPKKKKENKSERKKREGREKKERLKEKIEATVDNNIQELLDSEKTFVENITRNAKKSLFSSFYPFPKDTSFLTVGKHEAVVLIVRQHWISLFPRLVLAFLALFFPFLMSYSLSSWFESAIGSSFFVIGLFLFFMMVSATILVDGFLKWFFGLNMITTKRIIDVDFVSIVTHRISETTFDQVQDVSHCPAGPLASFFDYGHLYIQTAAAKNEFEFNNIPRPRDVQDTILDLRELRRKKIAGGD
jgi:membrane protein YdbS with pleckstrin-like domain